MKRTSRLTAVLLAFCLAATTMTAGVTAGAVEYTANKDSDLRTMVENAQNGDIIKLTDSVEVQDYNDDSPWVINRSVTIQGGTLVLNAAGIILNADVTFKDTTLLFGRFPQNAILANGHTLTLNNVTCASGGRSINLFCGGYVSNGNEKFDQAVSIPDPGNTGKIIIQGNTNLQGANGPNDAGPANIYAGNMCRGAMSDEDKNVYDTNNTFSGNAVIQIEGSASSTALGSIYACGAQQRIPANSSSGKETVPNTQKYTVTGTVDITLSESVAVYGKGSKATNVTYKDAGNNYEATAALYDLNQLTVESGNLKLEDASHAKSLEVNSGAILNLAASNILPITDFTGGGSLVLGQDQTLTISGAVEGKTAVALGALQNNASQDIPLDGHVYIKASASESDSFSLIPYGTRSDVLNRNTNGEWTATRIDNIEPIKNFQFSKSTFDFPDGTNDAEDAEIVLPLTVEDASASLDFIPLTIKINDNEATRTEDDGNYNYDLNNLSMFISENELAINNDPHVPDGRYTIEIIVPQTHTVSGTELRASTTLIVGNEPAPTSIEIPTAITGLKWTGQTLTGVPGGLCYTITGNTATAVGEYTATATPKPGYQWSDKTTDGKTITWTIAKADGPAAPTGLTPSAPTGASVQDGKITGTTDKMEYADNENFDKPTTCTGTEITSLAAGTYYVRVRENRYP